MPDAVFNHGVLYDLAFIDAIPKIGELRTLDIIENMPDEYPHVGTCLLNDDFGNRIKKLQKEYTSISERVEEIFRLWTNGGGAKWVGLVACLKEAKLNRLVDVIETKYCVEEIAERDERWATNERWTNEPQDLAGFIFQMGSRYLIYTFAVVGIVVAIPLTKFCLRYRKHQKENGEAIYSISIVAWLCKRVDIATTLTVGGQTEYGLTEQVFYHILYTAWCSLPSLMILSVLRRI